MYREKSNTQTKQMSFHWPYFIYESTQVPRTVARIVPRGATVFNEVPRMFQDNKHARFSTGYRLQVPPGWAKCPGHFSSTHHYPVLVVAPSLSGSVPRRKGWDQHFQERGASERAVSVLVRPSIAKRISIMQDRPASHPAPRVEPVYWHGV